LIPHSQIRIPKFFMLFPLTIFTGAFLLFLVQPLVGKFILPWFGGSPAVWTVCMLFFQVVLLAGYAYADVIVRVVSAKRQAAIHVGVLLLACVMLPIVPASAWKPAPGEVVEPVWRIALLLGVTLGLPYFALSTTGPLLQAWFARVNPGRSPYRLYALSNLGSLLALGFYPTLMEPNLSRVTQAKVWSVAMVIFAVLCAACAWRSARSTDILPVLVGDSEAEHGLEARATGTVVGPSDNTTWFTRALWLLLPACASALLLATTNMICQEIAVIPFLWVLPLGLYLLSFVLTFDSPRWYRRAVWVPLLCVALGGVAWSMLLDANVLNIEHEIALYAGTLFISCMVLHGELVRRKPPVSKLTSFYLMVSVGGALGGVFVAVVAPRVFTGFFELHVSLFASAVLAWLAVVSDPTGRRAGDRRVLVGGLGIAGVLLLGYAFRVDANSTLADASVVSRSRNFYGVLTVYDVDARRPDARRLLHYSGIAHGLQFHRADLRRVPTTYYGTESGVGLAMRSLPAGTPRRVGLVGLGVGTLAAYARPGDVFRAYDINPDVVRLARTDFTFLSDSPVPVDVVIADARLALEAEAPNDYDVLAVDAFSGDAIPVHLLTTQAFELYLRHVKPDGIVAVHVSNMHLDLEPVVRRIASHLNLACGVVSNEVPASDIGQYTSRWILLSRDARVLQRDPIQPRATPRASGRDVRLWTDDDTSLFEVLQ